MSEIALSFCIPTYNRANYIDQTIISIVDQIIKGNWCDCIEICVSDNASTDKTEDIISNIKYKYPEIKLKYSSNNVNLGADRNYLNAVGMAEGKYCWLFGSDDSMAPQSLARIMTEIELDFEIYLCNRINCDIDLKPIGKYSGLMTTEDRVFCFENKSDIVDYFNNAKAIYALFSYLSSIVVKRSRWESISYDVTMNGTAYSHAYILNALVFAGVRLKYLQEALVMCRNGNDSFAMDGEYYRFMIDFKGYLKITNALIADSHMKMLFLKVLRRPHPWYKLIKICSLNKLEWKKDKVVLTATGYSGNLIMLVEILGAIPYLSCLLIQIKRTLSRSAN